MWLKSCPDHPDELKQIYAIRRHKPYHRSDRLMGIIQDHQTTNLSNQTPLRLTRVTLWQVSKPGTCPWTLKWKVYIHILVHQLSSIIKMLLHSFCLQQWSHQLLALLCFPFCPKLPPPTFMHQSINSLISFLQSLFIGPNIQDQDLAHMDALTPCHFQNSPKDIMYSFMDKDLNE